MLKCFFGGNRTVAQIIRVGFKAKKKTDKTLIWGNPKTAWGTHNWKEKEHNQEVVS